jgi:hypothetical protein
MKKLFLAAAAAALLVVGGCAFHHVHYPSDGPREYVDWEPDPSKWGGHYEHY